MYIYSKITEGSASTIVHPRMKVMLAFNVNVIPNLDNAPKSQKHNLQEINLIWKATLILPYVDNAGKREK